MLNRLPLPLVVPSPFEAYGSSGPPEGLKVGDRRRIQPSSNGSVIAVSYEAREFGVKRNMKAQDVGIMSVPGMQAGQSQGGGWGKAREAREFGVKRNMKAQDVSVGPVTGTQAV